MKRRDVLGGVVAAIGGVWLWNRQPDDGLAGTPGPTEEDDFDGLLWVVDAVRPDSSQVYEQIKWKPDGRLQFTADDTLFLEGSA